MNKKGGKKFNKVNSFVDFSAFCVVEICGKLLSFFFFFTLCFFIGMILNGRRKWYAIFIEKFSMLDAVLN